MTRDVPNITRTELEPVRERFRVQSSVFRVQGSWFMVKGSGSRVQGSGFRVQSSGFRVQGSGMRVPVLEETEGNPQTRGGHHRYMQLTEHSFSGTNLAWSRPCSGTNPARVGQLHRDRPGIR